MKPIVVFVLLLGAWMLLVWPVDPATGGLRSQDAVAGVIVALTVALIMRDVAPRRFRVWLHPVRYVWLFLYTLVLAYTVIKASIDIAYRVLHPAMPLKPGIVKVKTRLRSPAGIAALCNAIALAPGTLVIHADESGLLYVHWMHVKSTHVDEATGHIVRRFEWFLKRVFDLGEEGP